MEGNVMSQTFYIKNIYQKDNFTFCIEWNDGALKEYRLSDLQKECPCAACVDESSGRRMVPQSSLKEDVRATRLTNVGRYALKIQFTSGCSTGIFDFNFLRNFS